MNQHSRFLTFLSACLLSLPVALPERAAAQSQPNMPAQLNELGSENGISARMVGSWDVTETVWDSPAAAPTELKNEVATRRMIGSMLEEAIHSASSAGPILRIDDLMFNRVEGRWEYVSMDTRAAVGIMTAQSYDRGQPGRIDIVFQPFSIPGSSASVPGSSSGGVGLMLRMRQEIIRQDVDHEVKNQYFAMADGSGTQWLAHRYAYVRQTAARRDGISDTNSAWHDPALSAVAP